MGRDERELLAARLGVQAPATVEQASGSSARSSTRIIVPDEKGSGQKGKKGKAKGSRYAPYMAKGHAVSKSANDKSTPAKAVPGKGAKSAKGKRGHLISLGKRAAWQFSGHPIRPR